MLNNNIRSTIKTAVSLVAILLLCLNTSLAQTQEDQDASIKKSELLPKQNSDNSSNKTSSPIGDTLLGNAPSSLMFDEEQTADIDRAVDSFLNNQSYVPDQKELQELQDEKAIAEAKARAEEEQARNEKSYLYLSSILYLTPKNWIVWIGDQKITSEDNTKTRELYIDKVSNDKAKVTWKLSISKWKIITGKRSDEDMPKTNENNQIETSFELRPNQTFILNENKIVEGKAFQSKKSNNSQNQTDNGIVKDNAKSETTPKINTSKSSN